MGFFDFLFPPRADESVVRDASLDTFLVLMDPELVPLGGANATALLPFPDALVRAAIHEAKYRGNEKAFMLLAAALAEYLRDCDEDMRHAVIIPVPLGEKRRQERGYNQAEEVARRAAKELGIAVETEMLARTRETISQVSLPREQRKENMRGAFGTAHSASPSHLYIVIDDVLTTGATLSSAVSALRTAGAENILPIALAH